MGTPVPPGHRLPGTAPVAELHAATPGHVTWPRHDPLAGIPARLAPARGVPPVRWPQGDLAWLMAISNVPSDPIGLPPGGAGGLVESGQLILFGGSLINTGAAAGHINLFDGVDTKGTQVAQVDLPLGASSAATSTATGAISAGAGSAALGNGVSATGFTLSFSAAPSTTGTAILSNVTGGPYTFNIPSGQTSPYTVAFPGPITASSAGVAPTLTIAGLGTGAGTIELYGQAVTVAASPAVQLNIPRAGLLLEIGLFAQVTAGSVTGIVYVGHVWKYPFTPPGE